MSEFSTIAQYISGFDPEKQKILNEVYRIIRKTAPSEAVESIAYKMPTFRYKGNLIHFAMFKNHLGLYPGNTAVEHFSDELKSYKTSRGTVQIPLDQPLPEQLIHDLVAFNVKRLNEKSGPAWDLYRDKWPEAEEIMQQLIVKTNLHKTFKWGTDIYTFEGKNVIGWGGFKEFFSLWFYNGVFLSDPYGVLISASEGKTRALRQWRFAHISEMDESKILAYIKESVQTIKDGKELKPERGNFSEPEGIFKEWLEKNHAVKAAFDKLTKGRQKEYIAYIEEAKQEKTKLKRIGKIEPLIKEGKGLNDRYRRP